MQTVLEEIKGSGVQQMPLNSLVGVLLIMLKLKCPGLAVIAQRNIAEVKS